MVELDGDRIVLRRPPVGIGKRLYGIYRGTNLLGDLQAEHRREIDSGR